MNKYKKKSKGYSPKNYIRRRRFVPYYKRNFFFKGILHVTHTAHNTTMCITDMNGNVFFSKSAGTLGYTGRRKSTTRALVVTILKLLNYLKFSGIKQLEIIFKGAGKMVSSGTKTTGAICRHVTLSHLIKANIDISKVTDFSSNAHNGCRQPKAKRLKRRNRKKLFF
ncbi:30S ribosomal protein S11 [Paenibacillus sp. GCM10012307]|uniref:Small ribosomal subunit protein uS11 n=1 Tax=Paenibacillus roseus TaxID=2798579 RepID=A0A934J9S5_9BACL|nr:30S ribosomal protein S11 [Paenibacillus roseus]MBJ6362893.1 30S ribosomal protein S11 [Paenibacillus roseus]